MQKIKMSLIAAVAIMNMNRVYSLAKTSRKSVFVKDEDVLDKVKKEKLWK